VRAVGAGRECGCDRVTKGGGPGHRQPPDTSRADPTPHQPLVPRASPALAAPRNPRTLPPHRPSLQPASAHQPVRPPPPKATPPGMPASETPPRWLPARSGPAGSDRAPAARPGAVLAHGARRLRRAAPSPPHYPCCSLPPPGHPCCHLLAPPSSPGSATPLPPTPASPHASLGPTVHLPASTASALRPTRRS